MAATAVPLRSRRPSRRNHLRSVGDDRLVARVRAGDDDAFEAIYDRYYLGLLAFCRHMLGSRDAAEDALQHSFASAYTALRGGDGVIDLRPWLYTIARNRCLSALRAQRDEISADGLELRARAFDGLAGEIQMRADLRDLIDDLQRLPEDQRAALVLFELGDQSHEQIAQVLGVRREKVKALVFQAREGLLRARRARDEPCGSVRQGIATLTGEVPRRSMLRTHIDRCPGCAAFEQEVRRQRAAFAAIMPVAPTMGLKASVLAIFGGGGAAAAGGVGAGAVAGSVAAGGTTVGLASLGAKGIVTKVLAAVALTGGATEAHVHAVKSPPAHRAPAKAHVDAPNAGGGASAMPLRAHGVGPAAAPGLRRSAARKHHSLAVHKVTTTPIGAAPSSTPATAAPVHPAPAPSEPPATSTPAPAPTTTSSAPSTSAPAASATAPTASAPTTSTTSPSTPTTQQEAAPAAAPASDQTAPAPAAAPTSTSTDATTAAPSTTSTQDTAAAAPAATAASAPAATTP